MGLSIQQKRMKSTKRRRISRRRRDKKKKKNCFVAPEIPEDLMIEILSRLPSKSVMRFKCISKFYSSLLSSSYFCNLFFIMVPSRQEPRLYMFLMDRRYYSKSLLLSSCLNTSSSSSSLQFDKNLTVRGMGGFTLRIVHGFISFTIARKAGICNPNTRQLIVLPAVLDSSLIALHDNDAYNISYFFCYDPVNDKYKVLCTISVLLDNDIQSLKTELWVYLLERGTSWTRVAEDFQHHLPSPLELTRNGFLYYLAWTDAYTCSLVSFNISSQEFSMIPVPRKPGDLLPRLETRMTQIEYGGKIAVFDFTYVKESGAFDVWVVEDWDKKKWSNKTLVLKPCQMHLIIDNRFKPKGTSLKGKIILVPFKLVYPFYFLRYDFESNDLEKVEIKGIPDRWFSMDPMNIYFDMEFMDPRVSIKCLELF